jgi:hypothetical protein
MSGIFETEIDVLCERLQTLKAPIKHGIWESTRYNGLLKETKIHDTCPETQERMRDLLMGVVSALDPFFARIAKEAFVGKPGEYDRVATDAVEGYLEWELQNRADEMRDDARAYRDQPVPVGAAAER